MKKLLAAVALSVVPINSYAEDDGSVYVSANYGAAIPVVEGVNYDFGGGYSGSSGLDTGFAFGAAIGYAFSNNIRVEGEIAYQQNNGFARRSSPSQSSSEEEKIHTLAGLVNGYYDFKDSGKFTPFIGAGIGVGGIVNKGYGDLVGAAFAYQVGGGLDYSITEKVIVGIKYRYTGLVNDMLDSSNAASHNIYAGARILF